jgi:hypothetical protein
MFALCRDERDRQAFITALHVAAGGMQSHDDVAAAPALVVLGLRADFYGHCIGYPELIPTLSGSQVVVGPMTEVEPRHEIQFRAARVGRLGGGGVVPVDHDALAVRPLPAVDPARLSRDVWPNVRVAMLARGERT